jgi:branched-chain amino acid transport system permease protein
LGFGEIVRLILVNWRELTHGTNGVIGIPRFSIAGFEADTNLQLYYVLLSCVLLGAIVAWRYKVTRPGREALSMKQGEIAAESVGVRTTRVKVITVVISAVYAAIAGSLYAHTFGFLSPDVFSFPEMITVVAMLIVGGQATVSGPIMGATILTFLPEWFRQLDEYWQLFYGVGVLVMVVRMPNGIAGLASTLGLKLVSALKARSNTVAARAKPDAPLEQSAQVPAKDLRR